MSYEQALNSVVIEARANLDNPEYWGQWTQGVDAPWPGLPLPVGIGQSNATWTPSDWIRPKRRVADCRVYWGSHGCDLERGHRGHHECDCCECPDHIGNLGMTEDEDGEYLCVATWPYYGDITAWYGEDATPREVRKLKRDHARASRRLSLIHKGRKP